MPPRAQKSGTLPVAGKLERDELSTTIRPHASGSLADADAVFRPGNLSLAVSRFTASSNLSMRFPRSKGSTAKCLSPFPSRKPHFPRNHSRVRTQNGASSPKCPRTRHCEPKYGVGMPGGSITRWSLTYSLEDLAEYVAENVKRKARRDPALRRRLGGGDIKITNWLLNLDYPSFPPPEIATHA